MMTPRERGLKGFAALVDKYGYGCAVAIVKKANNGPRIPRTKINHKKFTEESILGIEKKTATAACLESLLAGKGW